MPRTTARKTILTNKSKNGSCKGTNSFPYTLDYVKTTSYYSVLKLLMGFAIAAFIVWKPIVDNAVSIPRNLA